MIVYPTTDYNSFASGDDAYLYFRDRLHAEAWTYSTPEPALMTAYRSLQELDIEVDLTDSTALQAIKDAQCEQALYESIHDLDNPQPAFFGMTGLSVKMPDPPGRYAPRALAILKPYLSAPVVTRTR